MNAFLTRYRPLLSAAVLVVLYGVGIVGLHTAQRDWFLAATPVTLLVTAGLLLWSQGQWNRWAAVGMVACTVLGFAVEVLGVHGGWVFGEYAYGPALGIRLAEVPLLIGVNWLLLLVANSAVAARLPWPWWAQAAVTASLMTALDVLIEPVAPVLGFWTWTAGAAPLRNFVGWWVVAFLLASLLHRLPYPKQNSLAVTVISLQFLFFGILNLWQ